MPPPFRLLLAASLLSSPLEVSGHPFPEVPVRASFSSTTDCTLEIEVDPRCLDPEPNAASYLMKAQWDRMTGQEKKNLLHEAAVYAAKTVTIEFVPGGKVSPKWSFEFIGLENATPEKPDDPVIIRGIWKTHLPNGATGYRITSDPNGTLAVVFINEINGKLVERLGVLFPGETSYTLDISETARTTSG